MKEISGIWSERRQSVSFNKHEADFRNFPFSFLYMIDGSEGRVRLKYATNFLGLIQDRECSL